MKKYLKNAGLIILICIFSSCSTPHYSATKKSTVKHEPKPTHSKSYRDNIYIEQYGTNWHANFFLHLKHFDRRHKTTLETTITPKIIKCKEAESLLREDYKPYIFNNKQVDKLIIKVCNEPQSIALYAPLPRKENYPKALIYIPFESKFQSQFNAVGLGHFLGTGISNEKQNSSESKENNLVVEDYKNIPTKIYEDYILILKVENCPNTPKLIREIKQLNLAKDKTPKTFIDYINNQDKIFNKYAPLKGGPILIRMNSRHEIQDLQYSTSKHAVKHFFWRAGALLKEPSLNEQWQGYEDTDRMIRTISINNQHTAVDFRNLNLNKASFVNSVITGSHFGNSDLTNAHFQNAYIYQSNFSGAKVDWSNFEGSIWINSVCPNGENSIQGSCQK